ncbi:MAG TPA: Rieske (2Fe-2S) protein [Gemmatimonadaceae bacterium]|nr:Rieske (2Fe-2S) protein [Gemmatimonadaceae bacterium]
MSSRTNDHGMDGSGASEDPCARCAAIPRRDFLREAGLFAAGVLVALGAAPSRAFATPIEFISATRDGREDKTYPIPAQDGVQIDKDAEVMLTRWQNKVYAFALACPHQNTALHWQDKDQQFECPKHHSRFDMQGVYIKDSGRATRGLDRLAIRKDGNNVVVNVDKLFQEDDDEANWKTAFVALA